MPAKPTWVGMCGVPAQVWNEVFYLLGNFYRADHLSGQSNSAEEERGGGEVLILLDRSVSLPSDIPLWVEDLKFLVKIKEIDGVD